MNAINFYNDPRIVSDYSNFCAEAGCSAAKILVAVIKHFKLEDFVRGGYLIDIASGSGTSIVELKELGFKKYLAIDAADNMLARIPSLLKKHNIVAEIQKADFNTVTINAKQRSAEMVSCCNALCYMDKLEHIFSEVSRVSKPGGIWGFNLIMHTEEHQDTLHFFDEDDIKNYVHSSLAIFRLASKYGFAHVFGDGSLPGTQYISGIDAYEQSMVFCKRYN